MKKTLILIYLFLGFNPLFCRDQWIPLDDDQKYNEACFLVANEAFLSTAYGYTPYATQYWDMKHFLYHGGVRGFTFSIAQWQPPTPRSAKDIYVCHNECDVSTTILRKNKAPQKLSDVFVEIKRFIEKNQNEIITLFFDNKGIQGPFEEKIKKLQPYLLTPADWNPVQKGGWPTIKWLRTQNKRIIVFAGYESPKLFYSFKDSIAQTEPGETDPAVVCSTLSISKKPKYLYMLNFFPNFPEIEDESKYIIIKIHLEKNVRINYNKLNTDKLKNTLTLCVNNRNGRYPNFIALDFVNKGDPIKLVNEINNKSKATKDRSKMFQPFIYSFSSSG